MSPKTGCYVRCVCCARSATRVWCDVTAAAETDAAQNASGWSGSCLLRVCICAERAKRAKHAELGNALNHAVWLFVVLFNTGCVGWKGRSSIPSHVRDIFYRLCSVHRTRYFWHVLLKCVLSRDRGRVLFCSTHTHTKRIEFEIEIEINSKL